MVFRTGRDIYVTGEEKTITLDATWSDSGGSIKQKGAYSETNEYYKLVFKGQFSGAEADAAVNISSDIEHTNEGADYSNGFIAKVRQAVMYQDLQPALDYARATFRAFKIF